MGNPFPRAAGCLLAVTAAGALAATSAAQERPAAQRPVLGTCNYSPVAASLERSMEFYRTVAGLEFGRVSTKGPTQKVFLDIHGVAAADATFRWVIGRVVQQRCGIEPLEFGNVDRKVVDAHPGVTTAVFFVADVAPVLARVEAGIPVVSTDDRAVMLRDPDGHFVEVREKRPGLRDVPVRLTRATLAEGPVLELVEFKDLPRTPIQPRIQDPGATRLQLMVPDARRICAAILAPPVLLNRVTPTPTPIQRHNLTAPAMS